MKSVIALSFFVFLAVGCKENVNEKMENAIKPYVRLSIGLTSKIDEIKIVKVDTATPLTQINYQAEYLAAIIDKKVPINNINKEALERTQSMYNEMPSPYTLNAMQEKQNQYDEYFNREIKPYYDEITALETASKTIDSTRFLAYEVKAVLKYSTVDNVQKKDSIAVLVSKEGKVIERRDFWANKF